jgi:hypothetical protein
VKRIVGPEKRLIALYGDMRGGKDTMGSHLMNEYGFKHVAFGDVLRTVVYAMYPEARDNRVAYRMRMQDIGQHMRAYDPDVWVRSVERAVAEYHKYSFPVVVTDLRQPNEYESMRRMGAFIVRMVSPLEARMQRAGAEAVYMNHETESHYDSYTPDAVIVNDGTLPELFAKVDALMAGESA